MMKHMKKLTVCLIYFFKNSFLFDKKDLHFHNLSLEISF